MNNYFNKPFPFIEKTSHRVLASFLFSSFIYAFLITFQPFGISKIQFYKPIFVLGFFVITFVVLLFSFLVAPLIGKQFFDFDKWTIKRNTIFLVAQFFIISVLNWTYNSTIGKEVTIQHSLLTFIFITISVGIFPTFFLIYILEKNLSRKNQDFASDFNRNIQKEPAKSEDITIELLSKNKSENLTLSLNQLICIKSEGNYLKIFYIEDQSIKSTLIRNSISKLEEQLLDFEKIKRCHRSYLVNLNKVEKVSGNARNLSLHIPNLDFTIPVSRSFPKEILQQFNQ